MAKDVHRTLHAIAVQVRSALLSTQHSLGIHNVAAIATLLHCTWHPGVLATDTAVVAILTQSVYPHLLCSQATGCSNAKAEELIKRLSDSGRYHKDVW